MRILLEDLGFPQAKPSTVYQDNLSTIIMAGQGGNFKRTKHLVCKESFIKERLRSGEMALQHLPTKRMLADLFTKPLSTSSIQELSQALCVE
jgi:hypothetical protein